MHDETTQLLVTFTDHFTARLPTRLNNAGDLSLERQLAKTDAAQTKLPQIATGSTAPLATGVGADRKFRSSLRFRN